jgi:PiT family inorganic phosphate transporter
MSLLNASVATTISNMVNFEGDTHISLIALCAALLAIVVWAIAAWYFWIPTSESHALIAGISGAAIAFQGGFSGINGEEWMMVIYGLVLSTVVGFGGGWMIVTLVKLICKNMNRRKTNRFSKVRRLSAALLWRSCTVRRTV